MPAMQLIRQQYPMYERHSDEELLAGLYSQIYKGQGYDPEEYIDQIDGITPETKMAFYREVGHDPRFLDTALTAAEGAARGIMGGFESLATMATGAIAEPIAGFSGLVSTELDGIEAGAKTVEDVREAMTYQPRTAESQRFMGAVGELAQPVGEFLEEAQYGAGSAVEDLTGSRTAGAVTAAGVAMLPEILGFLGLNKLRPATRLKDDQGRPTRELLDALNEKGISYNALPVEVRNQIPREAPKKSLGETTGGQLGRTAEEIARQELRTGSRQAGLFGSRLEGDKIKADALGQEAVNQGFEEGFVQAVKTATPSTRSKMNDMLKRYEAVQQDQSKAARIRPTDVVGNVFMQRINFLRKQANNYNRQLNALSEAMAETPINTAPIESVLRDVFSELNIQPPRRLPNGRYEFDFDGSDITVDRTTQRMVKDAFKVLTEAGNSAKDLHKVKRKLDLMIEYRKRTQAGVTPAGQSALKQIRGAVNQALRDADPNYARINDNLSQILSVFELVEDATPSKISIRNPRAQTELGSEFRKLFSNYQNRGALLESLDQVEDVTRQQAKVGTDVSTELRPDAPDVGPIEVPDLSVSLTDLAMFSVHLDRRFGASAKTSLQGVQEAALERGAQFATQGATATGASMVMDAARKAGQKLRGQSDYNAMRTLEELVRRGGTQ